MRSGNLTFDAKLHSDEMARFQPPRGSHVLRCSFCELGEGEVERLFEGRDGYICNECVEVCVQLLTDYRELGYKPPTVKVPWYKRILGGEHKQTGVCSFCGTTQNKGEWLLASPHRQICERCINACQSIGSTLAVNE